MNKIQGRTVLLTGGSRGLGPVIAQELASRGARLALCARSESGLAEVADKIAKSGAEIRIFPTDLSRENDRRELVSRVLDAFGTIEILVNNAGLETEGAYADLSWMAIRETIEVNLVAPLALTHMLLPQMLRAGNGHIVNIASIAAKSGAPYAALYSGTKAGLAEWTRAMRLELKGTGVHFSTIFPGYVRDVGMFARFGVKSPGIVGSCSSADVARAVVRSIETCRREKIVNSPPLRYAFVINEAYPAFGDILMKISGVVDFQKRKVGK